MSVAESETAKAAHELLDGWVEAGQDDGARANSTTARILIFCINIERGSATHLAPVEPHRPDGNTPASELRRDVEAGTKRHDIFSIAHGARATLPNKARLLRPHVQFSHGATTRQLPGDPHADETHRHGPANLHQLGRSGLLSFQASELHAGLPVGTSAQRACDSPAGGLRRLRRMSVSTPTTHKSVPEQPSALLSPPFDYKRQQSLQTNEANGLIGSCPIVPSVVPYTLLHFRPASFA
ncbi:hypothetical protein E4U21_000002 [Claviceps maximensis]|nr:hypothetical protein E4U21_000002 [Claviceps maximensis]